MKKRILIALIFFLGCSCLKSFSQINSDTLLTGLALTQYQNSPIGVQGFWDAIDTCASIGVKMFEFFDFWYNLEPTPNHYDFQNSPIGPLTGLDPTGTKIKSYVYFIKMIDSNVKTVPSDLQSVSFGDTQMINRFYKLIDTFSITDSHISRITHLLIGNEVDAYLTYHPAEINGFVAFYQAAVNYVHIKMPTVKVGTAITYFGAKNNPSLFNALKAYGDFVDYTYYPDVPAIPLPTIVMDDINWMATNTGNKPFSLTEVGFSASIVKHSSDSLQAVFVDALFNNIKNYMCYHKVEFIDYQGMYDYAPYDCGPYAQSQGVDSNIICDLMNNVGLKHWATGQPRPAWNIFKNKIIEVNTQPCSSTGINGTINNTNKFIIYPNPFSSQTTLKANENLNGAVLTLYNVYGELVKDIKNIFGQTITLNRDNLPCGLYFLRLTEDNKTLLVSKLVFSD